MKKPAAEAQRFRRWFFLCFWGCREPFGIAVQSGKIEKPAAKDFAVRVKGTAGQNGLPAECAAVSLRARIRRGRCAGGERPCGPGRGEGPAYLRGNRSVHRGKTYWPLKIPRSGPRWGIARIPRITAVKGSAVSSAAACANKPQAAVFAVQGKGLFWVRRLKRAGNAARFRRAKHPQPLCRLVFVQTVNFIRLFLNK